MNGIIVIFASKLLEDVIRVMENYEDYSESGRFLTERRYLIFGDGKESNGYAYLPKTYALDKPYLADEYWQSEDFGLDDYIWMEIEYRGKPSLEVFSGVFKVNEIPGLFVTDSMRVVDLWDIDALWNQLLIEGDVYEQ
ncbi:hypothetical protein [Deinococcus aquatilis]|uniref:hypothetical protein n=1 Tax=Deinococcus aquatilis TaxID=519440 RepID=UPI0012FAC4C2|nr:hypothetical protein [Deinococcus aquatilis]